MNKKKLTKIILSIIGSAILAVVLILIGLGFQSINIKERGINYNRITGQYEQQVKTQGIHYIGVSNKFLKIKIGAVPVFINNLKCLSSDFVPVTLSAQISYTFNIPQNDANETVKIYKLFGENPDDIIRPIMQNAIQKLISTYDLSTLKGFNSAIFSAKLQTNLQNILNPITPINIGVILQSITANYQNQTSSSRIALLKQQINKLIKDIDGINVTRQSDYLYMVQNLIETTNSSLKQLINTETLRLQMVGTWINANVSTTKFRDYIQSGNQSYYQHFLAPNFIKSGF